jgi:gas vesicle protein
MDIQEEKSASSVWYLLGGLVIGAAAGVLLAPKSGIETREDIEAWTKRNQERAQSLIARISAALPARVKAAAAVGAVKGGAKEAVSAARDGLKQFSGT